MYLLFKVCVFQLLVAFFVVTDQVEREMRESSDCYSSDEELPLHGMAARNAGLGEDGEVEEAEEDDDEAEEAVHGWKMHNRCDKGNFANYRTKETEEGFFGEGRGVARDKPARPRLCPSGHDELRTVGGPRSSTWP